MWTCANRWKHFRISAQGTLHIPKTTGNVYFRGVFVIGVQLKQHNFGQWESFRGLVDISRMCLSCVSFGGNVPFGRYKPTKNKFRRPCRRRFAEAWRKSKQTDVDVAHCYVASANKYSCVSTPVGKSARLFEPILQWVPRYIATPLVQYTVAKMTANLAISP